MSENRYPVEIPEGFEVEEVFDETADTNDPRILIVLNRKPAETVTLEEVPRDSAEHMAQRFITSEDWDVLEAAARAALAAQPASEPACTCWDDAKTVTDHIKEHGFCLASNPTCPIHKGNS